MPQDNGMPTPQEVIQMLVDGLRRMAQGSADQQLDTGIHPENERAFQNAFSQLGDDAKASLSQAWERLTGGNLFEGVGTPGGGIGMGVGGRGRVDPRPMPQGRGPTRQQAAETQRLSLAALLNGQQTGDFAPGDNPSILEMIPQSLLQSLNQSTALATSGVPVVERSDLLGGGALVKPTGGPGLTLPAFHTDARQSEIQTSDMNYSDTIFGHEFAHLLGVLDPQSARTIQEGLSPEIKEAARIAYSNSEDPAIKALATIIWYNPLTWLNSTLGITNVQEQFAEGLTQAGFSPKDILAATNTQDMQQALQSFFTPESMQTLAATAQRTAEGAIALDQQQPEVHQAFKAWQESATRIGGGQQKLLPTPGAPQKPIKEIIHARRDKWRAGYGSPSGARADYGAWQQEPPVAPVQFPAPTVQPKLMPQTFKKKNAPLPPAVIKRSARGPWNMGGW